MADNASGPELPRGQGYGPPPKAPPHPMDPPRQGYPSYGPQPASAYPPPPQQAPYGAPPPYPQYQVPASKPTSGKAIASLVCGVVSVFMWPTAIVLGPVAMAMGWSALRETSPTGGKNGRGFAIGGMITGAVMLLVCVVIAAVLIFAFSFAEKHASKFETQMIEDRERQADADMKLIRDRLKLYYVENNRSLKEGGPIVVDGWEGGLFDENSPRVKGKLELKHLVRDHDLVLRSHEYDLDIQGDSRVRITNKSKGRELLTDDIGSDVYTLRSMK
ncbi:MAG: DUF4190 domain-containing protein [Planctomycetes bacterium]|nr:DUF4190 domain-containing protein [Planctomycetota bacterium]